MAVNQTEQTEHSSTRQRVEAVALIIGAAACLISTAASIHYGLLVLAALCALLAVGLLHYLIDKHSDVINERIVAFSLAFSLVALSILLPLWGVVNIVWAGQDARREIEETGEFTAGSSRWTATLEYPRVALQGEEGRPLELRIIPANLSAVPAPASVMTPVPTTTTITATSGITATTTITAMMPATATTPLALTVVISPVEGQGLRVVNDSGGQVAGASVPLPADGTSGHLSLLLHNDGALSGWRESRTLTVSLHDPASANAPIETLTATILVEGDRAFTLRRFVNSTIDEASPLIYVALLLLPVTAVLVQRLIDERKRRRLEQITRLWDEFREYFLAGEIGEPALGILNKLESMKHREPFVGQYLDTGRNFIDFANGFGYLSGNSAQPTNTPAAEPDSTNPLSPKANQVLEMHHRWPEGYAVAYLILHKKIKEKNRSLDIFSDNLARNVLSKARLRLQYSALVDRPDLRDRLAVAFATSDTFNIQSRRWPPAQPERTNAPRYLPFTGDDAAESGEAAFLAGNSNRGFYGRHPLFNRTLRVLGSRDAGTHLVYGAAGSGRTAFARTCANTEHPNEIAVLIRGLPDPVAMWSRLGRRLTEFVLTHPTHLEKMGGGRMSALASVLIDIYGYLTAISKVEHDQANPEGLHDLLNEDQREVAGQFLQLLARALTDEEARRDRAATKLAPVGWHDGFGGYLPECLRAFDFQLITFVIDLPDSDAAAAWLSDELPSLMEGQHSELTRYLVFTPRAVPRVFLYYPNNHTLSWTKSQLREMANTRYAHVYGRHGLAAQQFDPSSGLDTLIEQSQVGSGEKDYNPRQFLRLWRAAARGLQKEELIDATRVDQAIQEVKGSKS